MNVNPTALVRRIRRDVTVRTGLVVAGSALISLLLLTFTYWLFLVHRLESRIEDSLVQRHQSSLTNRFTFTDDDRALLRKFRQSLPVRDEGVFAWLDKSGNAFASSVSGVDCRNGFYDGWLDISLSAEDGPLPLIAYEQVDRREHDRFRFLARQRDENCLVFGKSMYEVDALRNSVRGTFIWLVPLCLLPSVLISLLYSMSMRARLSNFGAVVKRVADGDLDARVVVNGDDDIDQLARTSNRSFDRLQESVNTLQQLSSVIAHDLRGPLHRVSNPLDEAIRANESGNIELDSLYTVREGLNDAHSVFDALLRITQIESGRRRLQFKQIDLLNICEELFEVYAPVVEDSDRVLKIEATGDGKSTILGDTDLLRQAIVNLVENAIRYTPKGAHIRIGVVRHPNSPELFVSDNGLGVPEAELNRLVQRLYRYDESTRGKQGHGLGLSLVKAIAELHYGTLVLTNALPGLTVAMKLQHDVGNDA